MFLIISLSSITGHKSKGVKSTKLPKNNFPDL
jgi:hypothetical protein